MTWATNQKGGLADKPERFNKEKSSGASKAITPMAAADCAIGDPGRSGMKGDKAIIVATITNTASSWMLWLERSGLVLLFNGALVSCYDPVRCYLGVGKISIINLCFLALSWV